MATKFNNGVATVESKPKKSRQGRGKHSKYSATSRNGAKKRYRGQGKWSVGTATLNWSGEEIMNSKRSSMVKIISMISYPTYLVQNVNLTSKFIITSKWLP